MTILFNTLAVLLTIAVGAIHIYAIEHSLYWMYQYVDVIPHVLAGFAIGSWMTAVAIRLRLSVARMALYTILVALLVAGAWEVFEYSSGLTDMSDPLFLPDTLQDVSCAVLASVAFVLIYLPIYRRRI